MSAPEELEKVPGAHEAQTAKLVAPAQEKIKAFQTDYGVWTMCSSNKSVFSAEPEPDQYVPAAHSVQIVDEKAPAASISNSNLKRYQSFWDAQR